MMPLSILFRNRNLGADDNGNSTKNNNNKLLRAFLDNNVQGQLQIF